MVPVKSAEITGSAKKAVLLVERAHSWPVQVKKRMEI
jgi:hypothetical protein